ncbi:hypothetical protein O97_01500 [Bartonella henselae str. Zeus]|nr:hypothetical protein Q653_01604 [Bartonella henselae JK 42]ETS11080.1 hypothetical protein Q652_01577 [Bartonella henselae JK 41]KEC55822.1 hypothetical protein O97_01500 [Bartonella henselae str. Zeus]KEC58816.1 hypothetical protein O95_01401 [Bartonella henselae JK 53]
MPSQLCKLRVHKNTKRAKYSIDDTQNMPFTLKGCFDNT